MSNWENPDTGFITYINRMNGHISATHREGYEVYIPGEFDVQPKEDSSKSLPEHPPIYDPNGIDMRDFALIEDPSVTIYDLQELPAESKKVIRYIYEQ
jgi:hypothetical protein